MQNDNMKYSSHNRGYTLLFAVLTATLVLGVTIFILSVSKRQFALSNIARESMYAIYAADSGIECVAGDRYRSILLLDGTPSSDPLTFECNGRSVTKYFAVSPPGDYPDSIVPKGPVYSSTFNLGFKNVTNGDLEDVYGCAIVTVYAYTADDGTPLGVENNAIITSRGYNLCNYDPDTDTYTPDTLSPRTVERGMQLEYH
jgi:hypothetical protein